MRHENAESKVLRGTAEERDIITSRKGRPSSSKNMFASTFSFA